MQLALPVLARLQLLSTTTRSCGVHMEACLQGMRMPPVHPCTKELRRQRLTWLTCADSPMLLLACAAPVRHTAVATVHLLTALAASPALIQPRNSASLVHA